MDPLNGATPINLAIRSAQEQEQARQSQLRALKGAMENPHTVEEIKVAAFGIGVANGEKVLTVGTPDGKRRDFPLNPTVIRTLRAVLDSVSDDQAEAA